MFSTLVVLACGLVASGSGHLTPWDKFLQFKSQHGKEYTSPKEELARYQIFVQNLEKIEKHNQARKSWRMGITKFADITK